MSNQPPALSLCPRAPGSDSGWDLPPPKCWEAGKPLALSGGRHPQESVMGTGPVLSSMGGIPPRQGQGTMNRDGLVGVCGGQTEAGGFRNDKVWAPRGTPQDAAILRRVCSSARVACVGGRESWGQSPLCVPGGSARSQFPAPPSTCVPCPREPAGSQALPPPRRARALLARTDRWTRA